MIKYFMRHMRNLHALTFTVFATMGKMLLVHSDRSSTTFLRDHFSRDFLFKCKCMFVKSYRKYLIISISQNFINKIVDFFHLCILPDNLIYVKNLHILNSDSVDSFKTCNKTGLENSSQLSFYLVPVLCILWCYFTEK